MWWPRVPCTAAIQPSTRAVFAETLGNPSLLVLDIAAVSDAAHAHGLPLIVDNTGPSPFLCNPIAHGADIVVHSATKYLTGDFGFCMRCRMESLRVFGAALSPMSAWQILQGVETLPLRMERHCSNALKVAAFLQSHPGVSWVNYPGLPDHPQHDLLLRQMRGASGLLAFGVKGGVSGGAKGGSKGGVEARVSSSSQRSS